MWDAGGEGHMFLQYRVMGEGLRSPEDIGSHLRVAAHPLYVATVLSLSLKDLHHAFVKGTLGPATTDLYVL